MATNGRPDHDALYHRLFSEPAVVAQLLRSFADGPWLNGLDLDAMERLSTKFHAATGQRRAGDMIWRIPRPGAGDTYLVLLLEFQSTSDRYMALRVMTYAGLLWEQLETEQRLPKGGTLPPLLPVVVYNGESSWRAPLALRALVGLPEDSPLWQWQPDLRYHLIEAGGFTDDDLRGRDGLPALWFRLENARDPARALAATDALLAWLGGHPGFKAARSAFVALLGTIMVRDGGTLPVPEELQEVRNMLATRVEQWKQAWREEGLEEGRQEGRRQGHLQGLQEGLQQGRQQGRQAGEAALLLRLLERRFGPLPAAVSDSVRAADTAVLEEWGIRVLDAGSIDEVLEGGTRP
jgi:hypothetical protein